MKKTVSNHLLLPTILASSADNAPTTRRTPQVGRQRPQEGVYESDETAIRPRRIRYHISGDRAPGEQREASSPGEESGIKLAWKYLAPG